MSGRLGEHVFGIVADSPETHYIAAALTRITETVTTIISLLPT